MIVDDSKTSQMLVKTTLQRIAGLEFVTADDGRAALEVMKNEHVDLLVTDINMPEMDGIELIRAVRQKADAKTLPILIITAKGEEAARDQGLALGANGYILKPVSGRELMELASRFLGTSTATA
jgi:two-component system chemotaxis response regulator CheY